ncbi:MAG TPA: glycosyltransferase family 39 protein [Verrucomicrobiae bacterium]|nr:glycosyltransferase family 39 protein [Verrucomicrobiae bacterium]
MAVFAAVAAWIGWGCLKREDVAFLSPRGPAEWIVFPVPPDPEPITSARITTVFRRNFQLPTTPARAALRLRAFKSCAVTLNGQPLPVPATANWKTLVTLDATRQLRAGDNALAIAVTNSSGPPALWLELAADGFALLTDESWQASCAGSVWRPAWLARRPVPAGRGNPLAGAETVSSSLRRCWPWLVVSAALCAGIVLLARRNTRPKSEQASSDAQPAFDPAPWALAGIVALWLVLFIHNFGLLPRVIGFDAAEHLRYIGYIQQHKSLPLASQGFEMHQPPLYYLVSATALGTLGLTPLDDTGVLVLRFFSLLVGIAQLLVLFALLRLMFPGRPGAQIAGLLLAGLLPAHLCLAHYTTNETLAALFVTASFYGVLRLLKHEVMSTRWLVATGVAFGAALLTKITALLAAPFVFGAIVWSLSRRRERAPAEWLRALGVPLAATLLVCGWHYARVWTGIGHPLAGHRDFGYGTAWWQQDGFRTANFYVRFGDALEDPFFSGTRSFLGGLYSTLWGDGLWSGAASAGFRAPWNYDLMAAGYALALVPTALLLIGLAAALRRFIREPTAAWFCALGILGATVFALVWMSLMAPTYALVKSFYGLVALAPMAALGAAGWSWIAERGRTPRLFVGVAAGVWAVTSFGSFWIRGNASFTHTRLGEGLVNDGRGAAAVERFTASLILDPKNVHARSSLAATLAGLGQLDEAARLAEQNAREHPDAPICHLDLASVAESRGDLTSAVEHTRRAITLAAERPRAHRLLASRLARLGRRAESIDACREGLRLKPADPDLHLLLAAGLAADRGATSARSALEAAAHFRFVLELAREPSGAFTGLSWLLATHPAAEARQGAEAVTLAERAVRMTGNRDASALRALAAAYAETGRFEPAADAVRQAMALSRAARDESGARLAGELLTSIEARRPFRDEQGRP